MIARAGGLDQGNIGPNLADAEERKLSTHVLFLAGSAINSIKDSKGQADPRIGAEAMQQALEIHQSGELHGVPDSEHVRALLAVAERKRLESLRRALRQRYPELSS
jgi:ribulose-bisphosphate carboxylase large chain